MPLMSTCLGRLGSRYSIVLDPIRKQVLYGSLGLRCQQKAELILGVRDTSGRYATLPFCAQGEGFWTVDQHQSMTGLAFDANNPPQGLSMHVEITAPFWPEDEKTSLVPAYIVEIRLTCLDRIRWTSAPKDAPRKGVVRFGLQVPDASATAHAGGLRLEYAVDTGEPFGPAAPPSDFGSPARQTPSRGSAVDLIVPLEGPWQVAGSVLAAPFDLSGEQTEVTFRLAMVSYCGDALFERFGQALALKYTTFWPDADAVAAYVRANVAKLVAKSRRFDELFSSSGLGAAAGDLTVQAFQSYLACTLWATGAACKDWFSVWEGSCWFNSTVDVTYNESMFYLALWPSLLERVIEQWSAHADDYAAFTARLEVLRQAGISTLGLEGDVKEPFPGRMMQHDMGPGWTANGQHYGHAMPVEENANFLLLVCLLGQWTGNTKLYKRHATLNAELAEYLFWSDSKGNGFPDRGVANTIDDATPAVQYGRDNVYLGIKRLAALHAAGRMFQATGQAALAGRCKKAVAKAVATLNAHWLGDHWGVCLDKSAKGLLDSWTGKPLPYKTLPGWDAYSLYTTNGLLPLLMLGDLPPGLSPERLRADAVAAAAASMTRYGCGHSSLDRTNMWVSMNLWRDAAAGYLGENMLANSERYWNQQLFANGPGSEKPNCFTETSMTNNLVWYPRGAAAFGLPLAMAGLVLDRAAGKASIRPVAPGRWPLLPLADWKRGRVPTAVVESRGLGKLAARIEGAGSLKVTVRK